MSRLRSGTTQNLTDTTAFIELLEGLPEQLRDFFSRELELIVTRAPGRLDLMGGIADYSGSLVLELPIANATHAALQQCDDHNLHLVSLASSTNDPPREFEMPLTDLFVAGQPMEYAQALARFSNDLDNHWAAYVVGAFLVLMREKGAHFTNGVRLLIRSEVPEGKGVSSSAALEVATMQAIAAAEAIELSPRELAFLCQKVENLVAGAPCGVMDQMTSACGEADRLLALLCQPGELLGNVRLPEELAVWGLDSGIRHSVGGADYGTVRTAAFMGYRMIAELAGLQCRATDQRGFVQIDDPQWHGYLANITPVEFESLYASQLPREITGAEFLNRYQGITDSVTSVVPERRYPVLQATRHPIDEHARVTLFTEMLRNWSENSEPETLGQLMDQSHESYSACGLGSAGTDELIRLVRNAGSSAGLFGAKITGGGSGGTVAVLGRRDAEKSVRAVAEKYAQATGHYPLLISGSSPGAAAFGHLRLVWQH